MSTKMAMIIKTTSIFHILLVLPLLYLILINGNSLVTASQATNCSQVNCPPLSEITCPDDSFVRETNEETNVIASPDDYKIVKEVFIQCCVTQKCACRTCHIPSCDNSSLIIMELQPETEIPGKCCGKYDCQIEPNCSEINNTENYWLTDCKRCKCNNGKKECIAVCDESINQIIPRIPNLNDTDIDNDDNNSNLGACYSKKLNQFFMNGEKWKEDNDCTQCECFGEHAKCEEICNIIPPQPSLLPVNGIMNNEISTIPTCISSQLNKIFSNGAKWEEDNCTRCECVSGVKICHDSCQNPLLERFGPINCISTYLQRSFGNDETWHEDDGCSFCKCENGEKHCQTSWCKAPNCKNQVKIPGECCSRCLEDENINITSIPSITTESEETESPAEINIVTPIILIPNNNSTTTTISSGIVEEETDEKIPNIIYTTTTTYQISETTTQPPQQVLPSSCTNNNEMHNSEHDNEVDVTYYYWIITVLSVILIVFIVLYLYEVRRRSVNSRSYDPVSHTDDNFNRILAIKPITTYTYAYENEKEKINQNGGIKENEK
ncbi:cysteine-rich motor neuron 1 protein-like [Condylostylus longicornis]|uniref:cysteine-rich motor neuron 1 protein-like n=1 Tax=Condylostylus longicornis TaxID=2530218 RepID=UPI00244DFB66|nr:cysteine-rich motor neuron 1 protein-like [Condylostylus longicornis]